MDKFDDLASETGIAVSILKECASRKNNIVTNVVIKEEPECCESLKLPDKILDETPSWSSVEDTPEKLPEPLSVEQHELLPVEPPGPLTVKLPEPLPVKPPEPLHEKPPSKAIKRTPEKLPDNLAIRIGRKLRPRPKKTKPLRHYWTNLNSDPRNEFRDRALSIIDVDGYHAKLILDDDTRRLIEVSKKIQRPQICRFIHDSRIFFVTAWLTTSRIFEFHKTKNSYFEAKRIPVRYVDVHRDLITSVHYCDSRLYIAYISRKRSATSYIEVRNLASKKLSKPFYYDQIISSIESDRDFIYIKTINNTVHVHNKAHFELLHHRASFDLITSKAIIDSRAIKLHNKDYTKFEFRTVTESSFIISRSTLFEHNVKQTFNLDPSYKTVSAHFLNDVIILHRNLIEPASSALPRSKIDFGVLTNIERSGYFAHVKCLSLSREIIQLEIGEDKIFLFGCSAGRYEIGCLSLTDQRPIWCASLKNVDHNCKIIVQEDHIILFKSNHEHSVMKVEEHVLDDGILSDIKVEINQSM